ncbi:MULTISPECIES: FAD/NAD(P)-binding protein [unclassified Streptomyces]|uniref:FAD/NAD(P)-binding protein n=1 Tax=Streptomyces TaxID=1883 RepID=UPI000823DF7B|nr:MULTISPECIES: FAD/NAD(P)-binding protein [unclassified Streptomyces]AWN30528.1 oxidoreductase [Streptomyces sp. NEAU-S7GS2]MYT16729.1 oxidoreductase [Streptomyces sp. SID4951]SCK34797.1 NAD(P)H-flavin reductase [Streptomyces sp. SceaMP-e96]
MTAARPALAPYPYRVVERTDATSDTAEVVLEPVSQALPPFVPGQFAMVYAFGVGDIPLSLSGIDGTRLTHTVRAVGAVSGALHRLSPGETVGVRGPLGSGWDLPTAAGRDLVIVAGGLGLAPLRPLVVAALAELQRYGRLNILIGARTPRDLVCARDIGSWRAAGARVQVTVDRPDDLWQGDVGVVTTLLDRAEFDVANAAAFLCGPEVMIRAAARDLAHRGLPPDRIRISLERTMHCGTGHCGHCQLGPLLLCRDGPVVPWNRAEPLLSVREL